MSSTVVAHSATYIYEREQLAHDGVYILFSRRHHHPLKQPDRFMYTYTRFIQSQIHSLTHIHTDDDDDESKCFVGYQNSVVAKRTSNLVKVICVCTRPGLNNDNNNNVRFCLLRLISFFLLLLSRRMFVWW